MTASTLRAMLAYVDPKGGTRIAYHNDKLAEALVKKLRRAVGSNHGTKEVELFFSDKEEVLLAEFSGVAQNISNIFKKLV